MGVHGLSHDGQLYRDWGTFRERADRINEHMRRWRACGFRSPLMHRQPQWLQAVDAEYDCSFFDTDPYEPIPRGTMSVWPSSSGAGRAPITLVQDHPYTTRESRPRVCGSRTGVLFAHAASDPCDTPRLPSGGIVLGSMSIPRQSGGHDDYWERGPSEVARWWRCRAQAGPGAHSGDAGELEVRGAVLGEAVVVEGGNGPTVRLDVPSRGRAMSGLRVVRSL